MLNEHNIKIQSQELYIGLARMVENNPEKLWNDNWSLRYFITFDEHLDLKLMILRLDWIEHVDEGCIEDYELAASTNDKKNKRQNEVDEDDEDENKKKFKTN